MHDQTNTSRKCEECSVCCFTTNIVTDKFKKSAYEPCINLKAKEKKGCCKIYKSRPEICRNFECLWLSPDSPLPEDARPDKMGIMFHISKNSKGDLYNHDTGKNYILTVTEVYPNALDLFGIRKLINRFSAQFEILILRKTCHAYLPKGKLLPMISNL